MITEARAREIHQTPNTAGISMQDLREADAFVKREALANLKTVLTHHNIPTSVAEFVLSCASAFYGSVETDSMLMALNCYPDWLSTERRSPIVK